MLKLVSLFALLTACAAAPRQPLTQVAPPQTQPAPKYELLVLDQTNGATTHTIWIDGRSIQVGIAMRGDDYKVVRVDPDGKLVDIFIPPLAIPGVPAEAKAYNYWLPPLTAESNQLFVSASSHAGNTQYIATWTLTWNRDRGAFEISKPHVEAQPLGSCPACLG